MSENNSPKVRDIEKRELNSIVTSYVESKTRMLNVPDLIDWDIVGRKVSPEMVEVLQRQCKRLKKRGITIWTQQRDMSKGWESGKVYYLQSEKRYQDGPCSIGVLEKKVKRYKEYCGKNRDSVGFHDKGWVAYFVTQEPGKEKMLSSEDMVFRRLGKYTRVSELQTPQDFKQDKNLTVSLLCTLWVVGNLVADGAGYVLRYLLPMLLPALPGNSMNSLVMGATIGVACIDCLFKVSLIKIFLSLRRRSKSRKALEHIREQWPDFSIEKFIAMADNRVKCILYADSMAEIGSFAGCDLTKVLEEYENVVDCETLDFWFVGMSQDDTYQYLNVRQKVLLTGDLGYRMKRKKLTLELTFMRSRDSIMYTDFYCDWYIFEMKRV